MHSAIHFTHTAPLYFKTDMGNVAPVSPFLKYHSVLDVYYFNLKFSVNPMKTVHMEIGDLPTGLIGSLTRHSFLIFSDIKFNGMSHPKETNRELCPDNKNKGKKLE